MIFDPDPYLVPASVICAASVAGVIGSTIAAAVAREQRIADDRVREETRAALDAVPRFDPSTAPEVEAITGDLEVVIVCPHLSTLDRLDGLTCGCGGR